jgi:hypothetical protein
MAHFSMGLEKSWCPVGYPLLFTPFYPFYENIVWMHSPNLVAAFMRSGSPFHPWASSI